MVGLYSLSNTTFGLSNYPKEEFGISHIPLINFNPTPLGGVLAFGYHIHALVIPILKKTSTPLRYEKDVYYAFTLAFITYFVIGIAGIFGFSGMYFTSYLKFADS